jgi:hypothetical protein
MGPVVLIGAYLAFVGWVVLSRRATARSIYLALAAAVIAVLVANRV